MKHNKIVVILLLFALSLLLYSSTVAAESDFHSAMLANPCAGCHGTDGKSAGEIPSLDNLSADYILAAMKAFKSDSRPGTVMNRIAKGYSDAELDLMAKHFAKVNKK